MLALILLASCAVEPSALTAQHPANPSADTGRLAGAPATLRPGVASYVDVPALRTDPAPAPHHHHGS
ncbi:MAG: hypothetical protein ABI591_27105 [Kofleriaceae bacterium]